LENAEKLIAALDPTQLNPTVVAIRNAVVLNAAAGVLANQIKVSAASQLATKVQWQEAITAAAAVINSGAALEKLRNWQKFCAVS
jgi:anthranilate phosphoribosyltransferase